MTTGIGAILLILMSPIILFIRLTQGNEGVDEFMMNLYEAGFIVNMLEHIIG
jgi:hypothetical protein